MQRSAARRWPKRLMAGLIILTTACAVAFFGMDSAADVMANHPEIQEWWIAGHSLGGAMAGEFAAENHAELEGIVSWPPTLRPTFRTRSWKLSPSTAAKTSSLTPRVTKTTP